MILKRYLTIQFLKPFFFTAFMFAFIIQLGHLFDRLQVFVKSGISLHHIVLYLAAMLPLWLIQALPVCTLIAVVISVGNMSRRGEMTSLLSSGVSAREILKTFLGIAIFLTLMTFLLGDTLMPRATSYARTIYRTYVDKAGPQKAVWGDIIVLARDRKRISAKRLDLNRNVMETVTVKEYGNHFNLRQALTAREADWDPVRGWTFYDGVVRLFSADGDEIVEEEPFGAARLILPEKPGDLVPLQISSEEMSLSQLNGYIHKLNGLGIPALAEKVQFHLKLAFPFTHILVLILGFPIAVKTTRAGGGGGKKAFSQMKSLAVALVIGFIYLSLITVGQALGETQKCPPWLGIWTANLLFTVVGIYLLGRME